MMSQHRRFNLLNQSSKLRNATIATSPTSSSSMNTTTTTSLSILNRKKKQLSDNSATTTTSRKLIENSDTVSNNNYSYFRGCSESTAAVVVVASNHTQILLDHSNDDNEINANVDKTNCLTARAKNLFANRINDKVIFHDNNNNDADQLNDEFNLDSLVDRIASYDDLQRASVILRRALFEINQKQQNSNSSLLTPTCSSASPTISLSPKPAQSSQNLASSNSLNISSSSSAESPTCSPCQSTKLDEEDCYWTPLAFENLTYSSSVESLKQVNETANEIKICTEAAKKQRIKSIKRKDRLKKSSIVSIHVDDLLQSLASSSSSRATSMPDLTKLEESGDVGETIGWSDVNHESDGESDYEPMLVNIIPRTEESSTNREAPITDTEFESKLKKLASNKTLCRSLRKAKFVYLRNRRSKSLEDLSAEDRAQFSLLTHAASSKCFLKLSRVSLSDGLANANAGLSSSCSSSVFSLVSDVSSTYFNQQLNNWSPRFTDDEDDHDHDELDLYNRGEAIFYDADSRSFNIVFVSFIL